MAYTSPPVPPAPITDRLLATLIEVFERDRDAPLTEAEASLMFQATPGCLRELLTYRQLIGRRYGAIWIDGVAEAAPNVIRLADNRADRPADPQGVA